MGNSERKRSKVLSIALKIVKILVITLVVLAAVVFGLYKLITHQWKDKPETYASTNQYITELGDTMIAAHRAGRKLFPQGTMMAFEGCINAENFEIDFFEFDVHLTADEKLIVLHDNTLDDVTDAIEYFGKIDNRPENYTYEELRNLNFGENFKNTDGETPYQGLRGEDIPDNLRALAVTDALDYVESNGEYYYIIEVKNSGELGAKAADILYEILSERNMVDRVIVASFHKEVILHIEENHPDWTRSAYNMEVVGFFLDSLLNINRPEGYYKFDVLQVPPDKYVANLGTTKFVNYAHKNNIAVQYWTINDEEEMAFLQSIGADGVMTDLPDVAFDALGN